MFEPLFLIMHHTWLGPKAIDNLLMVFGKKVIKRKDFIILGKRLVT